MKKFTLYLKVCLSTINNHGGLKFLLLGRAIDMIWVLRLLDLFCAILKQIGEVLPALVGPLALAFSTLHMFLWGGAVTVGKNEDFS